MSTGAPISVSVIVPAYNAAQTLPGCIDALLNQTFDHEAYEIIIVDDGSTDGTAGVAEQPGVSLVSRAHAGPASARNTGIGRARGSLLLFTDADCAPTRDWIEKMVSRFADSTIAGCKGVYRTEQRGLLPRFIQMEFEEKYRRMAEVPVIDFVDTYSAAYRRSVLLHEGLFDEGIPVPSVEDVDLSFRLSQRGYRLVFNPQAVVYHHHSASVISYFRRKFRFGLWRVRVYERYPGKIRGDSHTPGEIRWQMLLIALGLIGLPIAVAQRALWWVPALCVVGFIGVSAPFMLRVLGKDPTVALVAPVVLGVRALALGLGLSCGLARFCADRLLGRAIPQSDVR